MGIPGILKEIGKGERIALSKLAVEHLERTRRPLRIAIDAAIWSFQNQAGQGGKNPALRTLFFRLLKLLALPIHPVFVYDGKNKPLMKRNKAVGYRSCVTNEMSKKMIQTFRMPHHNAPGEAEAECALLQKKGIVDAVMSQDVDAIMFGSTLTLRDWSKEAARGNKSATHVNLLRLASITENNGLDESGMVLVALLSGGDYNTDGVAGFGISLACEIAKAGFGADLLEIFKHNDEVGLQEWRDRLNLELENNQSGYFRTKHKSLRIPDDFPNHIILAYYTDPVVSSEEAINTLRARLDRCWREEIDVLALREHVADVLDWNYKSGAKKVIRTMAPALLAHRLQLGLGTTTVRSVEQIKERRQHYVNDGIPELRLEVVPGDLVGLKLENEEDNPEHAYDDADAEPDEEGPEFETVSSSQAEQADTEVRVSPKKKRKSPPWDPFAVEKMWIPEAVVKAGVPLLVEQWHQEQQEIFKDPKKFATRKCARTKSAQKATDKSMKPGALDAFVTSSKPCLNRTEHERENVKGQVSLIGASASSARIVPPISNSKSLGQDSFQLNAILKVSKPTRVSVTSKSTTTSTKKALARSQSAPIWEGSVSLEATGVSLDDYALIGPPLGRPNEKDRENISPSSTVTQRKRTTESPIAQRTEKLKTPTERPDIASFFGPRKTQSRDDEPETTVRVTKLPPKLSTGLKRDFVDQKASAQPRESLPGTWKEIIADAVSLGAKAEELRSRKPRISCVDLTGDD